MMLDKSVSYNLPWPPSINSYFATYRGRRIISRKGRDYKIAVRKVLLLNQCKPIPGRLSLSIVAHVPDKRKRDIDNLLKCLLDSLGQGGAYYDDSQIDELIIRRGELRSGGEIFVNIQKIGDF
jgi:crossover junction endodeoxyribonuclease RusA